MGTVGSFSGDYANPPFRFLGNTQMSMFRNLLKDQSGATAIEYGLIAALISVAAIVAFTAVGTGLSGMMTTVSGKLQ